MPVAVVEGDLSVSVPANPPAEGAVMGASSRARKLPVAARRELEVATAIAREAVFATHATRAEALIQLAGDRVSALRMLQIYVRLHGLAEQDGQFVINRVLADIGRRVAKGRSKPVAYVEDDEPGDIIESRSLLRQIRDRLRGRVMHDLRRGVELYVGVTEVVMLKVHVKHALRFVEILQPAGETIAGAVHIYRDTLGVRYTIGELLYYFVLDRIAADHPPTPQQLEPPQPQPAERATPARARAAESASAAEPAELYNGTNRRPARVVH
jgi:hypothetical protein